MRKISFFLCLLACGILAPMLPAATSYAQQPHSPVSAQTFTLQVMTLLDKFTADTELQKLRNRGYSAYIAEYSTESGKVLYKIRSGKYANRSSALAAAKKYQEQEGVAVMVVTASDDAPAGKAQAGRNASIPDSAEKQKNAGGKNVRITVKDADKAARPTSLQEKVAALDRGRMPEQDKKTSDREPDDSIWFTLQTSTEPDKQSAERRINQLGRKGYEAYCLETPLQNGKTQFKIRIGKYGSPEEAGLAAQKFNTRERRGCMVVKISPTRSLESNQPVAEGGAVAEGQRHGETDDIETTPPRGLETKSSGQKNESLDDTGNMPPADMPSEPEPSQPIAGSPEIAPAPESAEQTTRSDNNPEQMEAADNAVEEIAPKRMTKIYAYRMESGAVNLTNRYEDIPEAVRHTIEYIALFPVHIKELAKNGSRLTLEAEGQQTEIVLAGFSMPKKNESVRAYLEGLKTKPLRLKYSPGQTTKEGAIAGRLFLKEGSYVNLDMVRKGLGECSVQTLLSNEQEAFRQAQEAARRERVGIWAN